MPHPGYITWDEFERNEQTLRDNLAGWSPTGRGRMPREGIIQRLAITRVPVLVGQGIPLFGSLPHDVNLRHVATQAYATGLVKSEYEVCE